MKSWVRVLNIVLIVAAATLFAVLNGGERVRLDLGIVTLRSVSLPLVIFSAVLMGMLLVFLAGLRADLRTRRRLRRYRQVLEGEE